MVIKNEEARRFPGLFLHVIPFSSAKTKLQPHLAPERRIPSCGA